MGDGCVGSTRLAFGGLQAPRSVSSPAPAIVQDDARIDTLDRMAARTYPTTTMCGAFARCEGAPPPPERHRDHEARPLGTHASSRWIRLLGCERAFACQPGQYIPSLKPGEQGSLFAGSVPVVHWSTVYSSLPSGSRTTWKLNGPDSVFVVPSV